VAACPEHGVLAIVEGKARLVRASHCVGHGCCEVACPVGALVVGLGDLSARADIPVLTDERETTVPGVFIAGELSGIGLIRNAVEQGAGIIDTIAARLKRQGPRLDDSTIVDVLIVGCGPSGIAATLRAHELGMNYMVIDQDNLGGTVRKYPRNKMTMTQPVDLPLYGRMKRTQYSKEELIELWTEIFNKHRVKVRSGVKYSGLEVRSDGVFEVETTDGIILCRYCILALGRRGTPRRLGVPGEESERVLYQLVDAADHIDQKVVVVGGGDSAIEAALALAAQSGNTVTLSYRRNAFFRIKPRNREGLERARAEGRVNVILNSEVQLIDPGYVKLGIVSGGDADPDVMRLACDFIFVFAGGEPPYPLLKKSGIAFGGDEQSIPVSIKEAG
jgi:thioredoxin reductase